MNFPNVNPRLFKNPVSTGVSVLEPQRYDTVTGYAPSTNVPAGVFMDHTFAACSAWQQMTVDQKYQAARVYLPTSSDADVTAAIKLRDIECPNACEADEWLRMTLDQQRRWIDNTYNLGWQQGIIQTDVTAGVLSAVGAGFAPASSGLSHAQSVEQDINGRIYARTALCQQMVNASADPLCGRNPAACNAWARMTQAQKQQLLAQHGVTGPNMLARVIQRDSLCHTHLAAAGQAVAPAAVAPAPDASSMAALGIGGVLLVSFAAAAGAYLGTRAAR